MNDMFADYVPTPRRRFPIEPIARSAEVEGDYRWTLRRSWGAGPTILFCGLNPSKADGRRDDPTMWREIGFAYRWGFGSLIKVNLYPYISSRQDGLREWRRRMCWGIPGISAERMAFESNAWVVAKAMTEATTYVAAWGLGADPDHLKYFLDCARPTSDDDLAWPLAPERDEVPVDWQCLGTNDDGSPRHPLARGRSWIPDDAKLTPWRKP